MERLERPTSIPIIKPKISEEEKKKLGSWLKKQIDQALQDRSGFEEKVKAWRQQFYARLPRESASSMDAQVDIPITRENAQAIRSRILNPIYQQPQRIVADPQSPDHAEAARVYTKALKPIVEQGLPLDVADRWVRGSQISAYCFIKTGWQVHKEKVLRYVSSESDTESGSAKVLHSEGGMSVVEEHIETKVGCFPEVVPFEDMIFPWYAVHDIKRAQWLGHRFYCTKEEADDNVRSGLWDKVAVKEIGAPSKQRPVSFDPATDDANEDAGAGGSERPHYEMVEVYFERDIDKDGVREELIGVVDRESGILVSLVYNFLTEFRRPFVRWAWEVGEDGMPMSYCYVVEPLHRAYSGDIQQRLDAATRANNTLLVGKLGNELGTYFKDGKITPGYVEISQGASLKDDLAEFKLSQPYSQSPELMAVLQNHFQKNSAINEVMYGIDYASRPTASGLQIRIQEGSMPLFLLLDSFRKAYAEVAAHMLARYKQFYPAGFPVQSVNHVQGDEEYVLDMVRWPEGAIENSVFVRTAVSSQSLNLEMLKQEKLALLDKFPQIIEVVLGLSQQASAVGPTQIIAKRLLDIYLRYYEDFVKHFDVPKPEEVTSGISESVDVQAIILEAIQTLQGENEALKGQLAEIAQQIAAVSGQPGIAPEGPGGLVEGGVPPGMGLGPELPPGPEGPVGL